MYKLTFTCMWSFCLYLFHNTLNICILVIIYTYKCSDLLGTAKLMTGIAIQRLRYFKMGLAGYIKFAQGIIGVNCQPSLKIVKIHNFIRQL